MQKKNNTYSGWCLVKCLYDPPRIIEFLSHIKINHIASDIDKAIYRTLFDNYDSETEQFSPIWKKEVGATHIERLKELKSLEQPLDNDVLKISKGIKAEFSYNLLTQTAHMINHSIVSGEDPSGIIERGRILFDQAEILDQRPFKHISETLEDTMQMLLKRVDGQDQKIPTGFLLLDWLLMGGISLGEFVVIASMTGQGKSMFMSQIALSLVKSGKRIAILGLEMDDVEYNARFIATIARSIDASDLRLSNLSNPVKYGMGDGLGDVISVLSDLNIFYLQPKMVSVSEFKKYCDIAVNEHKVDAIFLDHTLLLNGEGQSQPELVEDVSKFMKNFATENEIISFAVAQMNRDSDIFNPKVSDMSGGRSIEHQATTLLTIGKHREQSSVKGMISIPQDDDSLERKITVLKSRSAPSGTYFKPDFVGNDATFSEVFPDNWSTIIDSDPNEEKLRY